MMSPRPGVTIAPVRWIWYQSIDAVRPSIKFGVKTKPAAIVLACSGDRVGLPLKNWKHWLGAPPLAPPGPGNEGVAERVAERAGNRKVIDRWGTDIVRPGHAETEIVDELALHADLPGFHQAGVGIVGHAAGKVDIQGLDELVLEDRDCNFEEAFLDMLLAFEGHAEIARRIHATGLRVFVDAFLAVPLDAPFRAIGDANLTGRQGPG